MAENKFILCFSRPASKSPVADLLEQKESASHIRQLMCDRPQYHEKHGSCINQHAARNPAVLSIMLLVDVARPHLGGPSLQPQPPITF